MGLQSVSHPCFPADALCLPLCRALYPAKAIWHRALCRDERIHGACHPDRRHCLCRHEGRRHSGGRHHCLPGFFRRGRGRDHHPSRRKEGEGGLGHKGRCKPHRGCGCCPSRPARRALSLLDSKAGRPSWWAGERDGTSSHPLGSCGKPPLGGCRCALRGGGEGREKAVF